MGLADRGYMREDPPGGSGGFRGVRGMRMWSANTWIIVLCIAVFFLDYFLPPQPMRMSIRWSETFAQQVDISRIDRGALVVIPITERPKHYGMQREGIALATQPNVIVGMRDVYWVPALQAWMHFSTQRGFLQIEFWRLIGFQFLHANMMHLLFNMLALYFFGPLVEQRLGSKRYTAFYLLSGIFGALLYVLLNLGGIVTQDVLGMTSQVPGLLFNDPATPLIGASAGVFGVLMAGAYIAPNVIVYIFFVLPMKLKYLAYALVAFSLFSIIRATPNAGGEAGHLGGAIAGWYLIRRPHHLHGFFDVLGRTDPSSHHYRAKRPHRTAPHKRDEIDRILQKVNEKGLHSLSAKEKRVLEQASQQ